MKNYIEIQGWVNSRVLRREKVQSFYFAFGRGASIRAISFEELPDIDKGDFVLITGHLHYSKYDDSLCIVVDTIEQSEKEPKQRGTYDGQYRHPKKQYNAKNSLFGKDLFKKHNDNDDNLNHFHGKKYYDKRNYEGI